MEKGMFKLVSGSGNSTVNNGLNDQESKSRAWLNSCLVTNLEHRMGKDRVQYK